MGIYILAGAMFAVIIIVAIFANIEYNKLSPDEKRDIINDSTNWL